MLAAPVIVAQSDPAAVLRAVGLIVLAAIVVVVIALVIRKIVLRDDEPATSGVGFSLADLREMRRKGELSDAEFERAKTLLIGRSRMTEGESDSISNVELGPEELPADASALPDGAAGLWDESPDERPDSPSDPDKIEPEDPDAPRG